MARRRRRDNTLAVEWSKRERDLMFFHDKYAPDGHLMHHFFNCLKEYEGRSFVEELDRRGFDLKTLRFSILRKDPTDAR